MKGQWKGFFSGILAVVLVLTLGGAALAAYQKQATLDYSGIKITLDGKELAPKDGAGNLVEPFGIDGTTYLPVRGIASAMGLDVVWDGATQTVKLSTPGQATTSTYGRTNPAPLGTAQTIDVESYSGNYTATITVTESIRGERAWQMLYAENQFNDPAPTDMEYILVKVKATVVKADNDKAISFSSYDFDYFTSDNAEYTEYGAVVAPTPLEGNTYAGASSEGYIIFMVNKADTAPKTVYGAKYDGTGGIWFKLT